MTTISFLRQRGAAVIMALLTIALVAGLAATTLGTLDVGIDRAIGTHDQAQARQLAQDAVDRIRQLLADDARRSRIDHLGEAWVTPLPRLTMFDGEVSVTVSDLDGRINLNNLIQENTENEAEIARLQRLLRIVGFSEGESSSLLAALLDWLDEDDRPRSQGGAEALWYALQTPPRKPSNGPLAALEELLQVRGYSSALLARLRPFISVLPSKTLVNVNTAPAEVLAASVAGLSLSSAQGLVAQRQQAWFKDAADFNARLGSPDLAADSTLITTSSRHFLIGSRVQYGVSLLQTETLLERNEAWPVILWQRLL